MTEIVNRQRKFKLDREQFRAFAETAVGRIPETTNKKPVIAFVSDRKMRELNDNFRGLKKTTDVLSFPFEADPFEPVDDFLGDIVISVERAAEQAAENGLPLDAEIKQLILHGILHLCGFDHETDDGEMNRRELDLRERLGI